MGFSRKWVLGAIGVLVVGIALLMLNREIRVRHDQRLERSHAALESGIHLYQQGSLDAAQVELGKALEADSSEWRTPFYLGVIQIQLRHYGLAIPYLEQAFILNPTEPKIPNALGVAYFKLGKLDFAKGYFETSLELDPANADTKAMVETMTTLQRKAALDSPAPDG